MRHCQPPQKLPAPSSKQAAYSRRSRVAETPEKKAQRQAAYRTRHHMNFVLDQPNLRTQSDVKNNVEQQLSAKRVCSVLNFITV